MSKSPKIESFFVLGIRVDAVQRGDVLALLDSWKAAQPRECRFLSSTNVNNVMCSLEDPVMEQATNGAGLSLPDGVPFLWLGRLRGFPLRERCGIQEVMEDLFAKRNYRHFFFGNTPGVLKAMVSRLQQSHPRLQICGTYSPPFGAFSEEQDLEHARIINEARPDFVWVSLGCPRQEIWIERNRKRIKALAAGGAGAVFNFLAGETSRAPAWVQRTGLEWAYRLMMDPKKLWKRYLVKYPKFMFLFVKDLLFVKGLKQRDI
jgi:N-acetylglucosaminyldiphosphoundecaprenol N-acetyl-beta-D-mannosaminyltransferase